MDQPPETLQYARSEAAEPLSKRTLLACAGAGLVSGPVALIATLVIGGVGVLASVAVALLFGSFIGRRAPRVSHILICAAAFGCAGALPLMGYALATYNPTDDFQGLTLFLSIVYPLMAGGGLFVFALPTAFIARSPR